MGLLKYAAETGGHQASFLFGHGPEIARQLWRGEARQPGGILRDVHKPGGIFHGAWWDTMPEKLDKGTFWQKALNRGSRGMTWVNRAGSTLLPIYEGIQALRGQGDPSETKTTNLLSALGSAAGYAYGAPLGGMILGGTLGTVGRAAGQGLGRLISGRPEGQTPPSLYGHHPLAQAYRAPANYRARQQYAQPQVDMASVPIPTPAVYQ